MQYISSLLSKMPDEWSTEDLLKLDTEGLEINGERIKGLIADVGETAIKTGEAMHYAGKDGALAQSIRQIQDACQEAGVSVTDFFAAFGEGDEEALKKLADFSGVMKNFNLGDLSINQLSAFNKIITQSGDRTVEFIARMKQIEEAGALPEFLDKINEELISQADNLNSVSTAINAYKAETKDWQDELTVHEDMTDVYDEFAKSVNKGQINSDIARKQMELLIGKEVDLETARQWVKDYKGLFLTADDDDNQGQELIGIFDSLHSKYNQLSKDQKSVVDGLMQVDWENGSISVAQHDVTKLAQAFGVSTNTMQQALDIINSYSAHVISTTSTMAANVKQLNSATIQAQNSVDESLWGTQAAWESLSIAQKQALEDMLQSSDINPTEVTVAQLSQLTDAWNNFMVATKGDISDQGITNMFNSLGDGVAVIKELDGGIRSIDVTNIEAVGQKWKMTEDQVRSVLAYMDSLHTANGDSYQVTVNGEPAISEIDKTQGVFDEFASLFEKTYGIKVNAAQPNKVLDNLNSRFTEFFGRTWKVNVATPTVTPIINGVSTAGPVNKSYTKSSNGSLTNKWNPAVVLGGGPRFVGQTGKMTGMATGGKSLGGKTLVGELGPEQWISRDGKHSKIVGKHGMEVINTRPGDAIVPANLTAGLLRGGISA